MALELARALAATERDDNLHVARLLLLLRAQSGEKKKPLDGLTKLAKLDFLLRYPNSLERALVAEGRDRDEAQIDEFERTTIESKMIRFRYGPWDHRYRRWVALMVARGLAVAWVKGKTVNIALTDDGISTADQLLASSAMKPLFGRAALISRYFGSKSGTALKNFVYETFPELTDMKWGEDIVV
ncbi:hypothetical protein ABFU27_17190 [Xanthomonas campestris pv. raphani]|uniref:hypothetical protein n=1 Tax=Xanthomonas campestris TaxID=339 RepID=UPI002B238252|nr:hypothetical protein [Xanthomonas campestris]MEA9861305.1 hypothetical protein [Xanthomonas campestris pv. raphani]MEA9941216.1 hypothetical protein [Xanthomonas campestris pv. raphani]